MAGEFTIVVGLEPSLSPITDATSLSKVRLTAKKLSPGTEMRGRSIDDWIKIYVEFLTVLGVRVDLDYRFEYEFVGECSYSDAIIRIGKVPPDQILLALAHETGHWLSHIRLQHGGLAGTTFEREIWAFKYGWWAIRQLGATELITKPTWRDYHDLELRAYAAYLKRLEDRNVEEN